MTHVSNWILALVVVCAAGTAHAKHPENADDSGPSGAHVSISAGEHVASLRIVPLGEAEPVAECENYCDFYALPGRYTLYTRDHDTGERRELGFRVKHSISYSLNEGNDTARDVGLAVGITGASAIMVGLIMVAPVLLSAMCEDANCTTDSERRVATVGLGLMAGGAIATPIGFTLFSHNRTTLKPLVDRSYATTEPGTSVHLGVITVSGGLGIGGLAAF